MEKNKQFKVVRVKRKREADAPQDLVVYDHNEQRRHISSALTDGLSRLDLSAGSCKRGLAQLDTEPNASHLPNAMHKRFKKLATMSGGEMKNVSSQEMQNLLNQSPHPPPADDKGSKLGASPLRSHLHQNARYEQVRPRHDGINANQVKTLNKCSAEDKESDPLAKIAVLYDVIRVEMDGSGDESLKPEKNSNARKKANLNHGGSGEDSEEDYVYDIYVEAEDDPSSNLDAWFELHDRGHAPVVHILQDDLWVVEEAYDGEESADDTEDSNAEDYYANDYPEEGAYDSSSSFDEWDDEGYGAHNEERQFYSKSGLRMMREWYDDSGSDQS